MSSVFLSSAEASGDHYAAELALSLRAAGYGGRLWGMGAGEARQAGVEAKWRGEQLQLMGFTEVLSSVPRVLKLIEETSRAAAEAKPDAVAVIDSPDYHLRFVARLRRLGYKGSVFYISPPTVWAWRSGRVRQLIRYGCECFPLYGFEHDYFVSHGCRSYWTGAPLLEEFTRRGRVEPPDGLADNDRLVAFMPGSRRSEVKRLLPDMLKAADILAKHGWQPVFSVAPGLDPEVRAELSASLDSAGVRSYGGAGRRLLAAAQCSVSASGTITVEAMLLERYMVSVYRFAPLTAFIAKRVVRTPWFSMANLLAGEEVYPELFQESCTPEAMAGKALEYLEGGASKRGEIRLRLEGARAKLGSTGVYDSWAKRIMECAAC